MNTTNNNMQINDTHKNIIRAIDNTGVRMFLYFSQTKKITIPENTCEAYQCSPIYENMPDSFADDFVYEDDYDEFKRMYYEIDEGADSASAIFHSKDLKFCHHVTLTTVGWTNDGKPESALGIIEDITDTMKTSVLLQELEEKLNKKAIDDLEAQKPLGQVGTAIGNLYSAIYHICLEDDSFRCFRENNSEVSEMIGERGLHSKGWNDYVSNFVVPEYREKLYAFGDYKSLAHKLHYVDTISIEYERINVGWLKAQFIVAERNEEGKAVNIVLAVYDINDEIKLNKEKKEAEFEAEHDPLTRLYNRNGFDRLAKAAEFTRNEIGFMLIDIDNFKALNDCYGHDLGDQVLVSVAENLKHVFRDEDKICRYGGDEISILLHDCNESAWEIICNKLSYVHEKLASEFADGLNVTLSAGVCFSQNGYTKELHLLADEALYETKQNGRAGCTLISRDHEILATWSDDAVTLHTEHVLEYTTSGMFRMEIPNDPQQKRRIICGDTVKSAFGASANATPEECYKFWEKGILPEYLVTIHEGLELMVSEGHAECTYMWNHPKWGTIYVRSNAFGEVKDGMTVLTGIHHVLRDTNLVEKKDEQELINIAMSSTFFGVMYWDIEHDTFSTVKTPPGDRLYKMGEMKTSQKLEEFITYVVDHADRKEMREFLDTQTIQERLGNEPFIACKYRSINLDDETQLNLTPVKYSKEGKLTHVLLTIIVTSVSDEGSKSLKAYDKKSLTALYNSVPAGIVMYEWNGKQLKTIHISEYYAREYGYTLISEDGDNKGGPDFKRVHPDDVEDYQNAIKKAIVSTDTFQYIYRAWNNTQQDYIWVKVDAVSRPQPDGTMYVYAVYTDITEQKVAQQYIEQSYEERLNSLLTMEQQVLSICEINLTRNSFRMLRQEDIMSPYIDETATYEEVMMNIVPDIVGEEAQKKYRELFSVDNLLRKFEEGVTHVEYDSMLKITEDHYEWVTAVVDMIRNPINDEIRGVAHSKSSQNKHMSRELLSSTLEQDYVVGAYIVKDTDEFYLYNPQTRTFGACMKDFWGKALITPNLKCSDAELKFLKRTLVKDRIVEYLETQGDFRYAFGEVDGVTGSRREMHICYADETKESLLATIRNITDISMMKKWKYESEHDRLTGLLNREATFTKCRELLNAHPQEQFVILHYDIRRFHLYNTFFGDYAGDELLRQIAGLFSSLDKDYDYWAYGRIESDVFCAFFPVDAGHFERHIKYFIRELANIRDDFLLVPAIGAYWVTDTTMYIEEMFSRATIAAKSGKVNLFDLISRYDEEMDRELKVTQMVTNEMNRALAEEEFKVYLQPKYSLGLGKIAGAEALARWEHPEDGLIQPGVFILVIEKNGTIADLDHYMWEHVCQILKRWKDEGRTLYPISVNISRVSMYSRENVPFLINLVKKYDLDPKYLELELTESAYMDDPEDLRRMLKELRDFGFKILIDDFGSGYSSLNTLRDLPVDVLKLDMKLLTRSKDDERGLAVLSSVVNMSKLLGLPTVAEGVEEQVQADYMRSLGCEYVQGFLFAKPMPIEEFEKLG